MALNLQIIGIAGTNGSGKDSAGLALADRHSYLFISVTDLLRAELNRRGLEVNRENMRSLSAEWRRQYGLAVLIDRAVQEYERLKDRYVGVAIASLRNPYEADRIHELGGMVLWIDADPRVRYERVQNNAEARSRAGEDSKTFEEFLAEEEAEMHSASGDAASLDMSQVKRRADIFLVNDNTDLKEFQDFISQQLFGLRPGEVPSPQQRGTGQSVTSTQLAHDPSPATTATQTASSSAIAPPPASVPQPEQYGADAPPAQTA